MKTIWQLGLHESVVVDEIMYVRMPGGWACQLQGLQGWLQPFFVPYSQEFNPDKKTKTRELFKPPTPDEVKSYCIEKGLSNVDPIGFWEFYASKGWMVGKNKMKDWRIAVSRWNREHGTSKKSSEPSKSEQSDAELRAYLSSEL